MATLTYKTLLKQLGSAMLAGDANRVPLLRHVLAKIGEPEQQVPKIHVVGTNGKGSTVAMLRQVLQANGQLVGTFSSPPILDDREQLQINGQMISEDQFVATYEQLLPTVITLLGDADQLSVFEWEFLIAVQWFANEHVDVMIFEAGLGGLLDATNAISVPDVSVFTHIALDHTRILGHTITEIAQNKAGIIKSGTTVVIAAEQMDAAKGTIESVAKTVKVPVINSDPNRIIVEQVTATGYKLAFQFAGQRLTGVTFKLVGVQQLTNLGTVLTVLELLRQKGWQISESALRTGLKSVALPGRFTQLSATSSHAAMILDGAHNPDSIQSLGATLHARWPQKQFTMVLGFLADKNVINMVEQLMPLIKQVIVTTPDQHMRALPAEQLADMLNASGMAPSQTIVAPTAQAVLKQLQQIPNGDTPIIVTGSFYLLRALWEAGLDA
ncbi:bifunctional folylpolyglutamate synthase/dihydrofolate synthase [Furfurilactobacillus siliginis]|uniref:tetrahydrofolate synthase n=1 Tax=Furfurilactobacillus siliginis TaxID=348151 RepID=A0A0R2KZ45_9LACO|nr:Mur ligase family protein [Furfurilactobacillus siliginis]KRN94690.1 folylpolyglutamate synthase [Furfurilactobacillus siliginis]GEK28402.1 bifunctional folylpolyglutamate synthase/dihydrofolate synthase [Furfurilactobacillus siliginis]